MNNHFKIIIPLYNVEKWIKICLRSVKTQSYENFRCIIIDDISTDRSVEIIKNEIKDDDRFQLIVNEQKAFALKNIYDGIFSSAPNPEDIVITLDGDDWLANKDVLKLLNEEYNKRDCWLTYGSYAEYPSSQRGKFAKQIPQEVRDIKAYRSHEWCSSHLRTFKYHLWEQIEKKDLLDTNGNFYRMTWDLAFMFPMLEMCGDRSHYIKEILYVYKRLQINFIDSNISHAKSYNDALEAGRPSYTLEYLKNLREWKGVTVFTDAQLDKSEEVISDLKVAWIMEPRAFSPRAYRFLENNIEKFNFVLTYDESLLMNYPNKCIFTPADGIFIDSESVFSKTVTKEKLVSHIYSHKRQLEGHRLRHQVADMISKAPYSVDTLGSGTGKYLNKKSDGLNSYYFSIVIENNRSPNYFTEKILDCFACKTIPLYWGAPNINKWFDMDSIICFETLGDLEKILLTLSKEEYESRFDSLMKNYEKSIEFFDYDKIISDNILKGVEDGR